MYECCNSLLVCNYNVQRKKTPSRMYYLCWVFFIVLLCTANGSEEMRHSDCNQMWEMKWNKAQMSLTVKEIFLRPSLILCHNVCLVPNCKNKKEIEMTTSGDWTIIFEWSVNNFPESWNPLTDILIDPMTLFEYFTWHRHILQTSMKVLKWSKQTLHLNNKNDCLWTSNAVTYAKFKWLIF